MSEKMENKKKDAEGIRVIMARKGLVQKSVALGESPAFPMSSGYFTPL